MRDPSDYPNRILLMTIGLVPQVLTETVWALAHQEKPFIPSQIHIITTAEGAHRTRLTLLDKKTGRWWALAAELGIDNPDRIFAETHLHVPTRSDGHSISDIVSIEDNEAIADLTTQTVAERTFTPDSALHASIAGGRKTMGFLLGYAMSLFGRPQDRLSHILVDDPFQQHPDFYYPPKEPRILRDRNGRPVSTEDAKLHLADIPFVRLRHGVPQDMLDQKASYSQTVSRFSDVLGPPSLAIDLINATVTCHGQSIDLPDLLIAWYAMFAANRIDANQSGQPDHLGYTRIDVPRSEFLDFYSQVAGQQSGAFETTAGTVSDPIDQSYADEKTSRLNKILKRSLGAAAEPYLIANIGKRPSTKKALLLPVDAITINRRW